MNKKLTFIAHKAYNLRKLSLLQPAYAGSGHPTTCLSAADIVAVLFFDTMSFDPDNFNNPNADRFILSKGHASALLYAVWNQLGKLSDSDLKTYRQFDSVLEGHPTFRFSYTEAATGSLGIGLSIGVGEAYAAKMDKRSYTTYVLLGDSESAEGSVWEAAELASYYHLDNLVAIVDCNRLGQSTQTMEGWNTQEFAQKFAAFGFTTFVVDGHSIPELIDVLQQAKTVKDTPVAIIAKTIKGYGIASEENKNGFHGKPVPMEQLPHVLADMEKRFADSAHYTGDYIWQPKLPHKEQPPKPCHAITLPQPDYVRGDMVPTRKAFGTALAAVGDVCPHAVSLDAEVKNSTYAEYFEHKHPIRFVQCFIAEQNMVSMAVGMARRGKLPFVSTFGAFLSRAHDQIRMAAIGQSPLRLVGSHAGVSIGEDGPSQMALEDIAMMRALPESIILYPSDAVSAYKCVELMARYQDGISYLRTTRMATKVLYHADEQFALGGCKVLQQSEFDVACIVGAGITLHEALHAYEQLQQKDILVSVIDLYSVKPLDTETLETIGAQSGNHIIVVEDHYAQGGIGEAVRSALAHTNIRITSLAVHNLPRSGKPEELLAWAGIDAHAIQKKVLDCIQK